MKHSIKILSRTVLLLCPALIIAACSPTPNKPQAADPVSFLVFGDSGYHFDWPSKNDRKSADQDKQAWYENHLDPDRLAAGMREPERLPAIEKSPVTGGYVLSTGLYRVSDAMYEKCAPDSCRFALMLGDNIYPDGADGKDDVQRFEEILTKPLSRLGHGRDSFEIYSVLGNHDWKNGPDGARAQLDFMQSTPPFFMDGYSYQAVPAGSNDELEIFAIDTELLLATTSVNKPAHKDDLDEELEDALLESTEPVKQQAVAEKAVFAQLEQALQESDAKWKIVIGHHPLWSTAGGKVAQSIALRELILPILCRHADAYMSGHEHTLEIHQYDCSETAPGSPAEPLTQVVSGAAGKQRMVNRPFMQRQDNEDPALQTLFALGSTWGYAYATLAGEELEIDLFSIGLDGNEKKTFSHSIKNRIE